MQCLHFPSHYKKWPCLSDTLQPSNATEDVFGKRLVFYLSPITTLKSPDSFFSILTPEIPTGKATNTEAAEYFSLIASSSLRRRRLSEQHLHFSSGTIYRPRRARAGAGAAAGPAAGERARSAGEQGRGGNNAFPPARLLSKTLTTFGFRD